MVRVDNISVNAIPWYRWREVFICVCLVCYPIALLIALSGSLYTKKKGCIFKINNRAKYSMLFSVFCLMILCWHLLVIHAISRA